MGEAVRGRKAWQGETGWRLGNYAIEIKKRSSKRRDERVEKRGMVEGGERRRAEAAEVEGDEEGWTF
jgi:hypothetical protein